MIFNFTLNASQWSTSVFVFACRNRWKMMISNWFLKRSWWRNHAKESNGSGCISNQNLVCCSSPRSSEGPGRSCNLFFQMTLCLKMAACQPHCSSVQLARVMGLCDTMWYYIILYHTICKFSSGYVPLSYNVLMIIILHYYIIFYTL